MPVLSAVWACDAVIDLHTLCNLFDEKIGACADEHAFVRRVAIFGFEKVVNVLLMLVPVLFDGLFGVDKRNEIERNFLENRHRQNFRHHQKTPKELKRQQNKRPRTMRHRPKPIVQRAIVRNRRLIKIVDVNFRLFLFHNDMIVTYYFGKRKTQFLN